MKRIIALSLVAGMSVVLSGPLAVADMGSEMSKPHYKPTGMPASAERGQTVFDDHCALCLGLFGKGDGPRSAFFRPGVQYIIDFSNAAVTTGRDDQLREHIREGVSRFPEPAYVMPQFKYILSDEEMESALLYIKTLGK